MSGGISILMPVFDELATVQAAIDDALSAELPVPTRELVVVDDGSTDGTRELLRKTTWPDNVSVVFHERNLGKGAAIRTALQHATGEFAAILDADLETEHPISRASSSRSSRATHVSFSAHAHGRLNRRSASGT